MGFVFSVYCLGSTSLASKEPDAGKPLVFKGKTYEHIYILEKPNRTTFTISGPGILDIGFSEDSLTMEKIKKMAVPVLELLLDDIVKKHGSDVEVKMKGYSRGAFVARDILDKLKENHPKLTFRNLVLSDPYAGPINNSYEGYDEIESGIVVYSLTSIKFPTPAKIKKSPIVLFCACAHNKTPLLTLGLSKRKDGVYFYSGNDEKIEKYQKKLLEVDNPGRKTLLKSIKNEINGDIMKIENPITCVRAIQFFFQTLKIKTTSRRETIFLKKLSEISLPCKEAVIKYLKSRGLEVDYLS